MNQDPKKDNKQLEKTTQEELDELRDLQKEDKKKHKKPRNQVIAIEFGGVFHHNKYVNLIFSAIVNFIFAYFVIEIFSFAEYHGNIYVLALLMAMYTIIEEMYKNVILTRYFNFIIKTIDCLSKL